MTAAVDPMLSWLRKRATALLSHIVALWVAAQLVGEVRLTGPPGRQLLALLVAAGIASIASSLYPVAGAAWRRAMVRARHGWQGCSLSVVTVIVGVAGAVVLAPFLLWLGATVCGWLGLPLEIVGFWPLIVATVVTELIGGAGSMLLRMFGRDDRARAWRFSVARIVSCLAALWLAAAVLGRVTLDGGPDGAGPWWRGLLALAVLAVLFNLLDIPRSPGTAAVTPRAVPVLAGYALLVNGLMLWLVSWFSTGLVVTLRIEGFVTFALAALLTTAVMWLANLPMLVYPLYRVTRSGWVAGDAVSWIGGLRTSRYGYRWMMRPSRSG